MKTGTTATEDTIKCEDTMTWTTPKLKEINCGMEINMYVPAEDDRREYERDLF